MDDAAPPISPQPHRSSIMASCRQPQQAASLVLVATCYFLLLIYMTGQLQAARPEPRSSTIDHKKHQLQVSPDHGGGKAATVGAATVVHMEKLQGKGMEQQEADVMEECQEEEECLMRRTLVAHTDYIYTQGKHN